MYKFFNSTQKAIQKRVVMQISKTNMLGNIMARSNIIDTHNKQQVDKKILGRIIQDVASDATQRPGGCHGQSHSRAGCGSGGCGYNKAHSNTCGK